jgi:hypothetical protein
MVGLHVRETLLHRAVRQPNDCRPRTRHVWGTKAKPSGVRGAPTALLFLKSHRRAVNFDLDRRARVRSCAEIMRCVFLTNRRSWFLRNGTNLGHQSGGLLLSSGGLICCNSIRDTVQAQHKHIPRQRNGHHPRDSEPQSSPSFVVIFKLLGVVHGFRLKKLAAVTSAHGGLRGRGLRPRSQKVKRRPLSVVPDARAGGNIKKLPLISHKMAANRNDAFVVLAA